jgi:hypothetical protein
MNAISPANAAVSFDREGTFPEHLAPLRDALSKRRQDKIAGRPKWLNEGNVRSDLMERRRPLMDAWGAFCSGPERGNAVPLHRASLR